MNRSPIKANFLKVREVPPCWSWGRYDITRESDGPFAGRYVLTWADVMLNDDLYLMDYATFEEAAHRAERDANR